LKEFMTKQNVLEWIEPKGGCVIFPRIKKEVNVDVGMFHDILFNKYRTYVGKGHWFEEDGRFIRIGYSWEKTEKLRNGLDNVVKAINESVG
jgi:DNA-binding transcriptional MocR family regulator